MATHEGRCHCGAICFEVDGEITEFERCNCSICTMTAYCHWYVKPDKFRLLTPDSAMESYRFGTRIANNLFCRTCGVSPFRQARSDPELVDVNLRCVVGVDLGRLAVRDFDGHNWEEAMRVR